MYIIYGMALILSCLILGGAQWFWVELFHPFFLFFVFFHFLSLLSLLFGERERSLIKVLFIFATIGILARYSFVLSPYLLPRTTPVCSSTSDRCERISILYIDRTGATENIVGTRLLIARERPEILAVGPLTDESEGALELQKKYPYRLESRGRERFFLALYSTRPFLTPSVFSLGEGTSLPSIQTSLDMGKGRSPLGLSLFKGARILNEEHFKGNRIYFRRAVSSLRSDSRNGIALLGNVGTITAPLYQQFLWAAEYEPIMHSEDLSQSRIKHLTELSPVDHILVKGEVKVKEWSEEFESTFGVKAIAATIEVSLYTERGHNLSF